MYLATIPDQDEPFWQVKVNMRQGLHHLFALQATDKMALVDLARDSQADRRRHSPALPGDPAQDRPLPLGCPRWGKVFEKREPELIEKHDFDASALRPFLSWASRARSKHESTPRHAPPPAPMAPEGSGPACATGDRDSSHGRRP